MSTREIKKEEDYIKEAARINGYDSEFARSILEKHRRKQEISAYTTLTPISEPTSKKRICVPFYPKITNKLGNLLKRFGIDLVTKSTNLGSTISNFKDRSSASSNSGIYKISCTNCDDIYIGQTARSFEKRLQEHKLAIKNKDVHRSSVAEHMCNKGHQIDAQNSRIIKRINDNWKLDAYESLLMGKYQHKLMNNENSPILSNLFNLVNSL